MSLQRDQRALIKFEGRVGGKTYEESTAFDGGTSTRVYPLIIGSNSFIGAGTDLTNGKEYKGFEEQLIGMNEGESRIIEVLFPANYHSAELAGKPSFFKVDLVEFS
ncbi:MAG: FKBP-type peptidyl-prolyl cis-trans isomerase [Mycoplasmataceae bacterium]|nr:FKBP-type peptidyl-prolyl cis-trans isomerase [Mycoplasmataceae bacterium]